MLSKLENDTLLMSEWFSDNFMKLNKAQSHFLIFGAKNNEMTIDIGIGACKYQNLNLKNYLV